MLSNLRPASPRLRILLGIAMLATLTVASVTSATDTDPELGYDLAKQKQTIIDLRTVGLAMYTWVADEYRERETSSETNDAAKSSRDDPLKVDWSACPPINHADLRLLLVPAYLAELPQNDGWGNAYEFCLDKSVSRAHGAVGLRATGKDGRFEGHDYQAGPFPTTEFHRDMVWQDGYFITWPLK